MLPLYRDPHSTFRFAEAPREKGYGTVAVFFDLYGNGWDLVSPRPLASAGS